MIKYLKNSIILFICAFSSNMYSQVSENYIDSIFDKRGEQYFSFEIDNKIDLSIISKLISIDHKSNQNTIYAYANKTEFINFLSLEIKYNLLNDDIKVPSSNSSKSN